MTAYDCGKKRAADDAEVEIQVKPTCKPSWQGEELRAVLSPILYIISHLGLPFVPSDNHRARLRARGERFGGRLAAVYLGCLPKGVSGHDNGRMDKRDCLPLSPLPSPCPPCRLEQKD